MTTDYLKEQFDELQATDNSLSAFRENAFNTFNKLGIPTVRNEEWKYTRISSVFNKEYMLAGQIISDINLADINTFRLPGHISANELVFINGIYSNDLSIIRSKNLIVIPLEDAALHNDYKEIVQAHFNHSQDYVADGINALNTAFVQGGIFIYIPGKQLIGEPVYLYNITDTRPGPVLSQPRSLVYVGRQSQVTFAETYATIGLADSMTNSVTEIIVAEDASVEYYKIQDDKSHASQVSTTHIRQTGKSVVNTVTVSLDGATVRNNLHAVLEAPYAEAHLYGLYIQDGQSHIDNHTVVDNKAPNCLSNELYKGILNDHATGVFNGKVFVRKDAQKTNAFQSNKNVLLSDTASINTKPQLEIFADDVKCSHGCTVGSPDTEALFYLQSRGIPHATAMALLLQGFAMDVLEKIKPAPLRNYVAELIIKRLKTTVTV